MSQHGSSLSQVLGNDLVIFTISGYLIGEYVLRVFPLICKATQSCRLSLSLVGLSAELNETGSSVDEEGPIYGIYSFWRDFQRIAKRGHTVYALRMKDVPRERTFPYVERLCLSQSFQNKRSKTIFPFDSFPRLTKVEVSVVYTANAEDFLIGLWKLPLTSLIINDLRIDGDGAHRVTERGPPAFANTLCTLGTRNSDRAFLRILALFCRALKDIVANDYHHIMAENPKLTSLTLLDTFPRAFLPISFGSHLFLTKLSLRGNRPFFSDRVHSSIEYLSLDGTDADSAKLFLRQCPSLKHLSIGTNDWEDVINLTAELDPNQCKQITLAPFAVCPPTIDQVERVLLKKGFQINESFLLRVSHPDDEIEKIIELAPQLKDLQVLQGPWVWEALASNPLAFFTSFNALSVLHFDSELVWDQSLVTSLMTGCPMLTDLKAEINLTGEVNFHSQVLRKLNLLGYNGVVTLGLNLPQLTHLSLELVGGEVKFIQQLLEGTPTVLHLPRLRVLSIEIVRTTRPPVALLCTTGHPSLTQLTIQRIDEFSAITLQHLPYLRQARLLGLSPRVHVMLDLPGDCDVALDCGPREENCYNHEGVSEPSNFKREFNYDERWIEKEWNRVQEPTAVNDNSNGNVEDGILNESQLPSEAKRRKT